MLQAFMGSGIWLGNRWGELFGPEPTVFTPVDIPEFQYRTWIQGGLFFFTLFVGLLYSRYRQTIYRYYFLYVLAATVYTLLKMRAYTPFGHWLSQFPLFQNQLPEAVIWAGMAAYMLFLIELLDLRKNHPGVAFWLDRVAWLCFGYGVVYVIAMGLFNSSLVQQATFWIARLVLVPIHIGLLIWIARRVRSPLTPYVVLGNGLLLFVGILAWLRAGEVLLKGVKLPGSVDDLMRVSFGVLLEIMVLALALARRIQLLDQERDEHQRAYIAQLEENRRLGNQINAELAEKVRQHSESIIEKQRLLDLQRENQLRVGFEKRIAELEMLALRSQMNPHFLFNSLNSIEYLVLKGDEKEAIRYLSRFSRLLRLILNHSREETISLADELKALRLYLDIEASRSNGEFRYMIEIDSSIDPDSLMIPPMLLQPFAENAIWHGLMPSYNADKWLYVRIKPTSDGQILLEIEDNGIGRQKAAEQKSKSTPWRKSYGMDITQQRVSLFNQNYPAYIAIEVIDVQTETRTGTLIRIAYQTEIQSEA
ncbi:histidine kinase [Spirosoma sp. SC4-14]|uniref:histidine kinase n=1 Tax=Spirosoma sp. SC4-14 TaxID=3128900 RepID=UPI0030CC0C5D